MNGNRKQIAAASVVQSIYEAGHLWGLPRNAWLRKCDNLVIFVMNCISIHSHNYNDNNSFILTFELIKLTICNTMIAQYSHSQGNIIMTNISLHCNHHNYHNL